MSPHLSSSLWKLYESRTLTDLAVKCGGETFKVHKLVLCSQSKVFAAMCRPPFREALEATIDLGRDPHDAQVFRSVLCWLYSGSYICNQPKGKQLVHQASIYAFAHKYDTEPLTNYARSRYSDRTPVMRIAWEVERTCLEEFEKDEWEDFFASASIAYGSTPESDRVLRDSVIIALRNCAVYLKTKAPEEITAAFSQLLKDEPNITEDLLNTTLMDPLQLFSCEDCSDRLGISNLNRRCGYCERGPSSSD